MPPEVVVTLDIGGSGAKACAWDTAAQAPLGHAAVPYPAAAPGADPGMFDPQAWWQAAVAALRQLRERLGSRAGRCLGITVSAIRIPFVLAGADGEPVMPGLLNKDRRAQPQVARVASVLGGGGLYELTGHWPAPEFGLPKLLWAAQEHPAAFRAARTLLQLHDWFVFRLCGVIASERSSAGMSQALDVAAGTWATGLLAELGVPAGLLPELRPAGARAGGLAPAVAAATGLRAGTPVHAGGGDTHLSALSATPAAGVPVLVAGTTAPAVLAVPAGSPAGRPGELFPLLVSSHVVAGQRVLETNAGATGSLAAALADLGDERGEALGRALAARGFAVRPAADSCDPCDPGLPLTVLAGHPFFGPDGWAAAPPPTVAGLAPAHTGADVYQACLAGICLAVRATLDCLLSRSGARPPYLAVTGGMSASPAWTQLLADVTGLPVRAWPPAAVAGRAGALLVTGTAGAPGEGRAHEPGPSADYAAAAARYQRVFRAAQREVSHAGAR